MIKIVDLIFIGIWLIIMAIMVYSLKELFFRNKKKVELSIDKIEEELKYTRRRLEEDRMILLQKIECQKCFCKRKPGINFKERPIPGFVSIYPYTQRVMDIDCKFCHQDLSTELCLAKDKKYIEDRLKEHQSDERYYVLGEKVKE